MKVPQGYPEYINYLDFGGRTIRIYDWWSDGNEKTDSKTQKYYSWLEKTYNCKITRATLSDWANMTNALAEKVNARDDSELCLVLVSADFIGTCLANNMVMPWNPAFIQGEQFLSCGTELMKKGGKIYGVSTGSSEPRECVFFNKNLLKNAGIDFNEIYDLQKNGEWTWDRFESYMDRIQDKEHDIWGMTGNIDCITRGCVFGNSAGFFDYDENGRLAITADSSATMAGLTKRKEWGSKYMAPQAVYAPDGNWDWYQEFWKKGTTAFYIGQAYEGFNPGSLMDSCSFDWGCVAFPKGPNASDYLYAEHPNICVIPNVYDETTSCMLQQIYALYTAPVPGVKDDAWSRGKEKMTDKRAIEEFYGTMRKNGHQIANKTYLIGDENTVLGPSLYWALDQGDPAALIEAASGEWQQLLDAFNQH
ncbi:MAG: hypothetical protein IJI09_01695 [Clostridia bacterium]|nr:hypothetical protein [Clostridia bacterium]